MNKIQQLGLLLKRLQIAYVSLRIAEKLYVLWNMTNNYHHSYESQMVYKV